jgi:hypothetical protein
MANQHHVRKRRRRAFFRRRGWGQGSSIRGLIPAHRKVGSEAERAHLQASGAAWAQAALALMGSRAARGSIRASGRGQ